LAITEACDTGTMGWHHRVLHHSAAKLRAVDFGPAHESEQVSYGVGAALALASTIHDEFALCAHRCRERFEWRLKLAQVRGGERVLARDGKLSQQASKISGNGEVFGDVADDEAKVPYDRLVEPGIQAACRWLYLGRPLKKLVSDELRLVGICRLGRRWPVREKRGRFRLVLELGVPPSSVGHPSCRAR
jgi:hypothetical protein